MEVFLYNSTVCRLCGEENDNGNLLYSSQENNTNLSEIINTYLPIKVSDDGHLPRTICPGCTIQLEAAVEFLNLIINGQKVLRELYKREKEYKKSYTPSNEPEIITEKIIYEINTSNGVYQIEHPIALQVAGLEKPKRKRGRPPKKPKSPEELAQEAAVKVQEKKSKNESHDTEEPTGKRRRKTPTRFKEVVQGKELERIFKEEGVTDGEDSDNDNKKKNTDQQTKVPEAKEPQVIGHMEKSGELVVVLKGKGRGRPKGRTRQTREQCMICGMMFSSIGRYMSHIAQHGPVLYQCTQCGETFSTRLRFCDHQTETKHIGQNILQCKDITSSEQASMKSVNKLPRKPQTLKDIVTVENPDNDKEPTSLSETPIAALPDLNEIQFKDTDKKDDNTEFVDIKPQNGESANDGSKPIDPLAESEQEVPDDKTKIKCNQCDKEFRSRQSKSLHIKAVHLGEKPYKCTECDAAFGYPRSLALHVLSHRRHKASSSKGYACDLCGKVLNHPSSVVYHKQAAHAGQRYVCGTCGKHFRHKQLLQRHQLVHSQLRPFNCKVCNATFKTKANLLNHQLLHSGVKKFTCEICKHKFAHKTSLTLHMRWHTGLKPYACEMCGKSFSQKGNLSEHERIHTGEKPYQCGWCPRRFTTSSQHKLHSRRHALDRAQCGHCTNRFPSRSGWSSAVRREAGGRLRCTICGRVFLDRSMAQRPRRRLAPQHDKNVKQMSLLMPDTAQVINDLKVESDQVEDTEERVIYITYDMDEQTPSLHILGREQELYAGSSLLVPQPALAELELDQLEDSSQDQQLHQLNEELPEQLGLVNGSRDHLPVTDEHGNPLHFTMQDGTRLAITSVDGKSLQVITQDGQTIPVEINGFADEAEVEGPETVVHQLNLQKSVDCKGSTPLSQYYTLV